MNILVVCTSGGRGGLELHARREARFLADEAGINCHLVAQKNSCIAECVAGGGVTALYLNWHFKALPLFSAIKLARYIDDNEIDLVHFHWGNDQPFVAMAKYFAKRKPTLVYTRHMAITRHKKDRYHRFIYGQLDLVLTVSNQVRQEAMMYFPLEPSQVKLLYSGVAVANAEKAAERRAQFKGVANNHVFNIGMFGRVEYGKGQHLLVEAVAVLAERGLDVSATIIGHVMDQNYADQLKQTIEEKKLSDRFEFVDFIHHPMEVMPCFDAITLLTYCETFGLVLVEAMRAGVAVIGTNAGGVPEIIIDNETGLLIPPGDAAALAESLTRLYDDETFKKSLAQYGQQRADTLFDETNNFNALMAVLKDVDGTIKSNNE
ncbi:MAG: glycosyltransferase family 4 protein [Gammaproteobacteria bacterium]|nr:glycosyltransferase family 4 protein [Gammaproteobacteria bacterium]